ncbi:glutamate--cysteine ligase [Kitasatospora terrestris]|uniref:Putative glutamate--cysteine ligase 2 n=1 Tax=Kitasatospora terrestris TaxID=258051 RepID=A0ABP9ENP9_9ACTN
MLTIGVEEEYLLLDPETGTPVARAEQVRAAAGLQPALREGEVQPELLQAQIEVATPVCHGLDEVRDHLLRLRRALAGAAGEAGCRLAATGAAPFADRLAVPVTRVPRYKTMRADAPRLTDEQLIAGMHVHVGIPDRETAVTVLNRLRPALPLLIALAANSPLWGGADTGFASWRTVVFGRWPVSGVPPEFADAADHDRRVERLRRTGLIRDSGGIYWMVRCSDRYPTIEVRAMDVQLGVDDAVMLAGLIRTLVAAAMDGDLCGPPSARTRPEILAAAVWQAARGGSAGQVWDPLLGRSARAVDSATRLLARPALRDGRSDDLRYVLPVLERFGAEGNGAVRQRRALQRDGREGLLRLVGSSCTGAARRPVSRPGVGAADR